MSNLKTKALEYARKGKLVFPIIPKCKIPLTQNGFKDASQEVDQIEKWWLEHPNANIGLPTGQQNGFFVLDIDGEEGIENLKKLEDEHGKLPDTRTVKTGGGGYHYYFKTQQEGVVKNSSSKIAPKIDIRGDGGYVVAPPSIHENGNEYAFTSKVTATDAPQWLLNLILQNEKMNENQSLLTLDEDIPVGQRNDTIFNIAYHILQNINDPVLAYKIANAVNQTYCKPPLSKDEFDTIINSICKYELNEETI